MVHGSHHRREKKRNEKYLRRHTKNNIDETRRDIADLTPAAAT